jgi:hypothetical protein
VFGVSCAFVEKVLRQLRTTGNIAPGGQSSRRDTAGPMCRCRGRDRGTGQCAHDVPHAAALRLAAQKKSLHASERDTARVQAARAVYRQRLASLDYRSLTGVDALGVNLALTRLYGRAPAGQGIGGRVPQNYGANVTLLGAPGIQGLQAVMTVDGTTDK